MTCIGWCVELEIDWNAWAAIGSILGAIATSITVYIALWLPRRDRLRKESEDREISDRRSQDAATMMLPMIVRTATLFTPVLTEVQESPFPYDGSRTAAQTFYFDAFDELRGYLVYFDVFPIEVRTMIAELIGWGAEWNSTVRRALLNDDPLIEKGFSDEEVTHLTHLHRSIAYNVLSLSQWCEETALTA